MVSVSVNTEEFLFSPEGNQKLFMDQGSPGMNFEDVKPFGGGVLVVWSSSLYRQSPGIRARQQRGSPD